MSCIVRRPWQRLSSRRKPTGLKALPYHSSASGGTLTTYSAPSMLQPQGRGAVKLAPLRPRSGGGQRCRCGGRLRITLERDRKKKMEQTVTVRNGMFEIKLCTDGSG